MNFSPFQRVTAALVLGAFLTASTPRAAHASLAGESPEGVVEALLHGDEKPLENVFQRLGATLRGADGRAIGLLDLLDDEAVAHGVRVDSGEASLTLRRGEETPEGLPLSLSLSVDGRFKGAREVILRPGQDARAISLSLTRTLADLGAEPVEEGTEGSPLWESAWRATAYGALIALGLLAVGMGIKEFIDGSKKGGLLKSYRSTGSFLGTLSTAATSGKNLTKGLVYCAVGSTAILMGVSGYLNGLD